MSTENIKVGYDHTKNSLAESCGTTLERSDKVDQILESVISDKKFEKPSEVIEALEKTDITRKEFITSLLELNELSGKLLDVFTPR